MNEVIGNNPIFCKLVTFYVQVCVGDGDRGHEVPLAEA